MYKPPKNSEQINPWTFRHRQTSRQFNDSTTAAYKPIKSLRQKLNFNKKTVHSQFNQGKNTTDLYLNEVIHEQQSRVLCGKLPKHSIESEAFAHLQHMQKHPPTYKFISFQYRSRPVKKNIKEKKNQSFVSNSMRQYTEGLQIVPRKQEKPASEYEKILKVRRYFTEEKDYEDYYGKKTIQPIDLAHISKTQQLRRPFEHTIKIVKTYKNSSREQVITKGKLFEKVQNICERKGISGGSHLSIMKRNYNIKKLEKILNQDKQ